MLTTCKVCSKLIKRKRRVVCGRMAYRDKLGREWKSRHTCPQCYVEKTTRNKEAVKLKFTEEKLGKMFAPIYHSKDRFCNKCSRLLTLSRWFYCEDCYQFKSIDEQFLYCVAEDMGEFVG